MFVNSVCLRWQKGVEPKKQRSRILTWDGPESQSLSWVDAPHLLSPSETWTTPSVPQLLGVSSLSQDRHFQIFPFQVADQCQSHQWKLSWNKNK